MRCGVRRPRTATACLQMMRMRFPSSVHWPLRYARGPVPLPPRGWNRRIAGALQLQRIPDRVTLGTRCLLARVPLKTSASRRSVRSSGTLLDRLRKEHATTFPRPEELLVQHLSRPVDPQNLTQWLSLKAREIGIACSPHRLRHTAATLMLNETGSIATVSSFLGHTELRTTSVLRARARHHQRRRHCGSRRRR